MIIAQECALHQGHRDEHAYPRPAGRFRQRPAGLAGWLGAGRPGGDVSGERGQLRVGPRGKRLAHPHVELVLVQPALHERGLERGDHVLAVGVGRPQVAAARHCPLVRSCHHRDLPWPPNAGKS
jgi:hypothetical protein